LTLKRSKTTTVNDNVVTRLRESASALIATARGAILGAPVAVAA